MLQKCGYSFIFLLFSNDHLSRYCGLTEAYWCVYVIWNSFSLQHVVYKQRTWQYLAVFAITVFCVTCSFKCLWILEGVYRTLLNRSMCLICSTTENDISFLNACVFSLAHAHTSPFCILVWSLWTPFSLIRLLYPSGARACIKEALSESGTFLKCLWLLSLLQHYRVCRVWL